MREKQSNSQSVVQIDELNLDKECVRLPSDYLKYAHLAADAKALVSRLENRLKVIEAELGKKIRNAPESFDLDKVTEAAVVATITTSVDFKEAQSKLTDARYNSSLAEAVVWALEHKKRSLTLLVELHGMGYFSNPKISERGREAVESMTKTRVRRSVSHED